jgi:hypothetical protein
MTTTTHTRTACPNCHGQGWTVADMAADGNGHWQECGCIPERSTGPVVCAPFCLYGDGQPAGFREDQWCAGVPMAIALPPHRLATNDPHDPRGLYDDRLEVMPVRRWEAGQDVDYVLMHQEAADSEIRLTPVQARELAINLLLAIGELPE